MFARGLFFLFQRFLPLLLFFLPRLFFLPPFGVFDRVLDLLPCELDLFRCWPLPGDLDGVFLPPLPFPLPDLVRFPSFFLEPLFRRGDWTAGALGGGCGKGQFSPLLQCPRTAHLQKPLIKLSGFRCVCGEGGLLPPFPPFPLCGVAPAFGTRFLYLSG